MLRGLQSFHGRTAWAGKDSIGESPLKLPQMCYAVMKSLRGVHLTTGKKVYLADLEDEHIRRYMELSDDPELLDTMGWQPFGPEEKERFLQVIHVLTLPYCGDGQPATFSIISANDSKAIGYVSIKGVNEVDSSAELGIALKEGSIPDADLGQYIKRQKHLSQAGISLDNLIAIVKQAKVMTADDGGKALAEKLSQFGNLDVAIEVRQNKLGLLTKETAGMEEKAKLKAKIETDIVKLKAERATHESVLAELAAGEKKLAKAQQDVTDLLHEQEALIQDIKQKEERRDQLDEEIADKEQKSSGLSELKVEREAVSAELAQLKEKKKLEVIEREIFESFLGVVASSLSLEAIEKFVAVAPQLIALAKEKEYSPELLRSVIIKDLSGGTLEILRCSSCQARFNVDKPAQNFHTGHHCQLCGNSSIEMDVAGPEVIKKALAALAPQVLVVTPVTSPKGAPPKNPGQAVSHD